MPVTPDARAGLPTVSVVVPTHNRAAMLDRVAGALLADPATTELVVVANGCRDGSPEVLRRLAAADRRVVPVVLADPGKVAACERGVAAAAGDVLLFVDDDVVAAPGMVSAHAAEHARRRRCVVVGYAPVSLPAQPTARDEPTRMYAAEYEGHCGRIERGEVDVLVGLWGGNFSMRRCDCLAVGFGSPSFGDRYHEDRELGLRCLKAGLTGVFLRSIRADHLHRRSPGAFLDDARSAGGGIRLLHELHGDLLGPLPSDAFEQGLPVGARLLVRAGRAPAVGRLATASVRRASAVFALLGLPRLLSRTLRVGRRLELQRGARRVDGGGHHLHPGPVATGRPATGCRPPPDSARQSPTHAGSAS